MRICCNIVRQYDKQAEFWVPLHSWTQMADMRIVASISKKEIIDFVECFHSQVEGDFQWGLAYHSYSQD